MAFKRAKSKSPLHVRHDFLDAHTRRCSHGVERKQVNKITIDGERMTKLGGYCWHFPLVESPQPKIDQKRGPAPRLFLLSANPAIL